MRNKRIELFFCWVLMTLFIFSTIRAQTRIDLSEKIIKSKNYTYNRFDDKGFGFYDLSDGKYKIFNWNLEIEKSIPITLGEGPSEVKPWIYNVCILKDSILMNGYLDRRINIYDLTGKFIKTFTIDFTPRTILYHRDKLYIFNAMFFETEGSPVFARILDPASLKTIKDIRITDKKILVKKYEDNDTISRLLFRYDINEKGNIYLLDIAECTLFEIDETGKLVKKTRLPHHFKMKTSYARQGTNVSITLDMRDMYLELKPVKDSVFFYYQKLISEDIDKGSTFQTYIVKLNSEGKISQKNFDGELRILGNHQGFLYLFDFSDYQVTKVKLSEWD
ncbi:MAG: 6-bladed beta-propeller [Acidobacteriota bacterium]|nr:6-bladed beta-propeller [Acidobacteriota bacterium]